MLHYDSTLTVLERKEGKRMKMTLLTCYSFFKYSLHFCLHLFLMIFGAAAAAARTTAHLFKITLITHPQRTALNFRGLILTAEGLKPGNTSFFLEKLSYD